MEPGALYNKLALSSPYVEVMLRKLYWKNVKWLAKYKPYGARVENKAEEMSALDFEKIANYLKDNGVNKGSLIVVHSSYDKLKGSGLKPNEIIASLRELIGEEGTLAMPVIRRYKEYPKPSEWLKTDFSKIECKYDPRRTPVTSGLLPSMLMREKGAVVSMHPLNTMAAVGPLAQAMMAHNIDDEKPAPHGPNSSWKFCADHNAIIVALGVPMVHHLTMAHVAEDCFEDWPYKDWYNDLRFNIVMPDKSILTKTVRERKPQWGLFYDAELNMENALNKAGIITSTVIGEVPIGIMRSNELISFLRNNKHKGFPYYKI